jgi:hypothetical protein
MAGANFSFLTLGLSVALVAPAASVAQAQVVPRTFQATAIYASCVRQYSQEALCRRTLEVVRARHGDTVTMLQWNAGVGVVRHQVRQGKL